MIKNLTCIECPNGCKLMVEIQDGKVIKVTGQKCEKGEKYSVTEIENPMRFLTSTVLTEGLPLKMVPVRTEQPIPKARIFEAMEEIRKIRLREPVEVGSTIKDNLLNLGIKLVATRKCMKS